MCLEHTFACNRFSFFSESYPNTHPLTPLHSVTRIAAAKWHWRALWACRLTLAHPEMGLVEDHPGTQLSPGCLGQFMTPTRRDCNVDTSESKWLSHFLIVLKGKNIALFLFQQSHLCRLVMYYYSSRPLLVTYSSKLCYKYLSSSFTHF